MPAPSLSHPGTGYGPTSLSGKVTYDFLFPTGPGQSNIRRLKASVTSAGGESHPKERALMAINQLVFTG